MFARIEIILMAVCIGVVIIIIVSRATASATAPSAYLVLAAIATVRFANGRFGATKSIEHLVSEASAVYEN